MKSTAKNTFVAEVSVSLPPDQELSLNRWLNLQHAGKELIPLNEKCSQEHKDAAWHLHKCRRYRMKFEINKKGEWKFIRAL